MTAGTPQVSIIIPAFNVEPYLAETLDSVLAQTFQNFEVLLVDDGSTDGTAAVAARYGDRVRYIHQANSGAPARPRNVAIAQARGRFICFFDSDDIMMPDKLARSVEFIAGHPELGLIFTNFVHFDERGDMPGRHMDRYSNFWQLPKTRLDAERYVIQPEVAFESLFFGNYVGTSSVIVPADVLKMVGPFDEKVSSGGLEDRDMWFRIAQHRPFGFLDVVGHRYRVRSGGVSKRALQSAEARLTVVRRYATRPLARATRAQANRLVAESTFTIGHELCLRGDVTRGRSSLLESLKTRPSSKALRWWVLSNLGGKIVALWRRLAASFGDTLNLKESL